MGSIDFSEQKLLSIITNWENKTSNIVFLFLLKLIKTIFFAVKNFREDNCQKSASALTYYTLLSIVPVLAMFFGIAKGFGFDKTLEDELSKRFADQQQLLEQLLTFTHSMLNNAKGGLIAGLGLIVLFWSVMKLLGKIEESFNEIWSVRKERNLWKKFSEYLAIMLVSPILIIMSSSLNVFLSTQVENIVNKIGILGVLSPAIFISLKLVPYIIVWILFSIIYILMPNTKVSFSGGIFAGIIAGSIFQITQSGYIILQYNIASYNAIYGSFAALPLLLIWLQLSWLVILFGSEISYTFQNLNSFQLQKLGKNISNYNIKIIALHIMSDITKSYDLKEKPIFLEYLSNKYQLSDSIIKIATNRLCDGDLITEVKDAENNQIYFLPLFDINKIFVSTVIDALDKNNDSIFSENNTIVEIVNGLENCIKKSNLNKLVKDL